MVCGGILLKGRTNLVCVEEGTLMAHRYIKGILDDHVVLFAPFIGNNFILMQDNARPHVDSRVNEYLDEVGIMRMDWPACSHNSNPIEQV